MALVKVVGNYYNGLLDYFDDTYKLHGSNLKAPLLSLSPPDAEEYIKKYAETIEGVETLKATEKRMWESKRNGYIMVITFCYIAIVSSFLILMYSYKQTAKVIANITDHIRVILGYIILYLFILTLLIITLVHFHELETQSKKMASESGKTLDRIIRGGTDRPLLNMEDKLRNLLLFVGYKNTEQKLLYTKMMNIDATLAQFKINMEAPENARQSKNPDFYIDYNKIYNTYKRQLAEAADAFYDEGKGYAKIRTGMILTSNVLILSEFNNIIDYYKTIVTRIETDSEEAVALEEEFIRTTVLPTLITVMKLQKPMPADAYTDPTSPLAQETSTDPAVLYEQNISNEKFARGWDKVNDIFFYIIMYAYQIDTKTLKTDTSFDPVIKNHLPTEIDLSSIPSVDTPFYSKVKNAFVNHQTTVLPSILQNLGNITKEEAKTSLYATFRKLIEEAYVYCIMEMEGPYYFPFNGDIVADSVQKKIAEIYPNNTSFHTHVDQMIRHMREKAVGDSYRIYKSSSADDRAELFIHPLVQSMVTQETTLLSSVPTILKEYKIATAKAELMDYEKNKIVAILKTLDTLVASKKQSQGTDKNKIKASKYITSAEFINKLDNMTFDDVKQGLKASMFYQILDKFYVNTSNSINSKDRTLQDIYYADNKKFKIVKSVLVTSIILVVLVIAYNTIDTVTDLRILNKQKEANAKRLEQKTADAVTLLMKYNNSTINVWMRLIVPWFVGLLFCSMIVSFYVKGVSKFNFNKGVRETNTRELKDIMKSLKETMQRTDKEIKATSNLNGSMQVKNLSAVLTQQEKTDLYHKIISAIDRYDKCNFITSQVRDVPFPWTEAFTNLFMIAIIVMCIFYAVWKISPGKRLTEIRKLTLLRNKGKYEDGTKAFSTEVSTKAECHDREMESIAFMFKVLFFMFIIIFLVFYSSKVITSTSEFEFALYSSTFLEESRCYE